MNQRHRIARALLAVGAVWIGAVVAASTARGDEPPPATSRDKAREARVRSNVSVEVIDDARHVDDFIARLKARQAEHPAPRSSDHPAAVPTKTQGGAGAETTPVPTTAKSAAVEPEKPTRPALRTEAPEPRPRSDATHDDRRERRRERESGEGRRR